MVYHIGIKANGYIADIDPNKQRDKYKVVFTWARHCTVKNGRYRGFKWPDRKWQWCQEGSLVVQPVPPKNNKVTVLGDAGILDNLIRSTCQFPRRQYGDGSDIVLSYGKGGCAVPESILVLNRHLMTDKYIQQSHLPSDIGIESKKHVGPADTCEDWICKPYHSIGGKDMYQLGAVHNPMTHYIQRKFNKVREFRAHVFLWESSPCAIIQEKKIADKDQLCWNQKQGSTFFSPYAPEHGWYRLDREDPGLRQRITDMGVRALKAIRYDFGGIDVGMDASGVLKVFEVNSRMGIRERSLRTYKRVFWNLYDLDIDNYIKNRWA